jgi:formylglycine-generating enzyme required for sulfatase activity
MPSGESPADALGIDVAEPDEILSVPPVAGAELAIVCRGKMRRLKVPPGVETGLAAERTAYPLILAPECQIRGTALDLLPGSYLLYARHGNREDLRYPVLVERGENKPITLQLLPKETTPPGFVWIPPGPAVVGGDPWNAGVDYGLDDARNETFIPGFFIRRTEVTTREYLEFLNDPETLRRIDAQLRKRPRYLPRHYNDPYLLVRRGTDRRWVTDYDVDAPLLGVSAEDIGAFLAWRNARAKAANERWLWGFPDNYQWEKAARGTDGRPLPWGDRFDPALCVCPGYRPEKYVPNLHGGSEPRDESPFGVLDMAGSRREWCGAPPTRAGTVRGGSWADGDFRYFRASFGDGLGPGYYNWSCGFRPVLVENQDWEDR